MAKTKKVSFWENKVPNEVKVMLYLAGSAALAEVVKYLELVKVDNVLLVAVINVLIVLVKTRGPQVKERLTKN